MVQPRTYEASSTIFISTTTGDEVADLQVGTSVSEQRAVTYAQLVNSPAVLNPVLEELDLGLSSAALTQQIEAQVVPGTSLLEITAAAESPRRAALLVDAVSESLSELSGALEEMEGAPQGLVTLSVLDTVSVPEGPAGPGLLTYLGIGALAGLILGVGWALLRHSLNTRIHSAAEVAELTDRPIITAPHGSKGLRLSRTAAAHRREALTALEAHLHITSADERHAVIVTSPVRGEDTTAAALDLAAAAVSAGRRTIVIDADPDHHRMTRRLDLCGRAGLTEVLDGAADPDQVLVPRRGSFDVMPAGSAAAHREHGIELDRLLSHLTGSYELIIVDTPPVLPGTDNLQAGHLDSGTLVVARAGSTDRAQLLATLERLRSSGTTTLGVLLLQPSRGPDAYKPGQFRWIPARGHRVAA